MYRTILWDNDGILVKSEDLYYEATREIMREVKVELTLETYRQYFLTRERRRLASRAGAGT